MWGYGETEGKKYMYESDHTYIVSKNNKGNK